MKGTKGSDIVPESSFFGSFIFKSVDPGTESVEEIKQLLEWLLKPSRWKSSGYLLWQFLLSNRGSH